MLAAWCLLRHEEGAKIANYNVSADSTLQMGKGERLKSMLDLFKKDWPFVGDENWFMFKVFAALCTSFPSSLSTDVECVYKYEHNLSWVEFHN